MPLKIYRIKSEAEPSRLGNAIIDDETVVEEKEKKKREIIITITLSIQFVLSILNVKRRRGQPFRPLY